MSNTTLASALLSISSTALACQINSACPDDSAHWVAECTFDGQAFQLVFDSPSKDGESPDMSVTLVTQDGRQVALPLPTAFYRQRAVVANQPSLCTGIGAFATSDQVYKAESPKVLVWLSVDQRPGSDVLALALVDFAAGKLVHHVEGVAPIKDPDGHQGLAIQVTPEGYSVRLERLWMHNTGTDSAENSIEDWMQVSVAHGRIRTQWK